MFHFSVTNDVHKRFPDHVTAVYGPFTLPTCWDAAHSAIANLKNDCINELASLAVDEIPRVSRWKTTYKEMGASPKYMSSVESLLSRFMEKKELYKINPLVDLYNWLSLSTQTPMAAYDIESIAGEVQLRMAAKGEPFVPLGNPKQTEKTKNGEVIYADEARVICRYWNYRDCHETRIIESTSHAIVFGDLLREDNDEHLRLNEKILDVLSVALGQQVGVVLEGE